MLPKNVKSIVDAQNLASFQVQNGIPLLEFKNLQSWSKEMYDAYSIGYAKGIKDLLFLNDIPIITMPKPNMLSIPQLKELLATYKAFNISNQSTSFELIVEREFATMETLAIIANNLDAFELLNVQSINNYFNKALILDICTHKYNGHIVIIVNGADLYDVFNTDGIVTTKMIDNVDCFNIQSEIMKMYTK
jgi:hypothetical protein